jgi:DNA-binding PadR family transcriptional regulator
MKEDIVGEKEISEMLGVRQGTVHRWRARGLLPPPDGYVSGAPAWHWSTVSAWADKTGRSPRVRDHILAILDGSPNHGNFTTPITRALAQTGMVGADTTPARIASVLTDLLEDGLVSIHLRNEWRLTEDGVAAVAGVAEEADLARLRDLYRTYRAFVAGSETGYYTERRYRSSLDRYARALIEAGELPARESQQVVAALRAVRTAEALPWSPKAVSLADAAYARLQLELDGLDAVAAH